MRNEGKLTDSWNRGKLTEKDKQKSLPETSRTGQSKTTRQFIKDVLLALKSKRGFKEFAFFVANNPDVQKKLQESQDKNSFKERLMQFGKEKGYEVTEKNVKDIPDSWSATSVEKLLSNLVNLGKGGLQQFLNDIKNKPILEKDLDKNRDLNNFVTFLKNTLNQSGGTKKYPGITDPDIEEAVKWIPPDEPKRKKTDEPAEKRIVGTIWS